MTLSSDKTAVFICHCSGNISDHVDLRAIKKELKAAGIRAFDYEYLCSGQGQALIKSKIAEGSLEKIVIGSCTPSKHGPLFKKCVQEAGLNPAMLEIANLREQCAWVHLEKDAATKKALFLILGKIKRLKNAEPLEEIKVRINPDALVIGGGIAGITSALNLAENGVKTYLVEKNTSIGGQMAKIGKIFSPDKLAEECAMCSLSPLMNEVLAHRNITLITNARIETVNGSAGNFSVRVKKKPEYVKDTCIACGSCERVCPVLVENEFNCGNKDKKAVSMRFAQAVPQIYHIDPEKCLEFKGEACRKCEKACKAKAIDFTQEAETLDLNVGAIIAATGFDEYDASLKPQYGYGVFENVVTQMELARILGINGPTKGKLLRPSDAESGLIEAKTPERVVMIQCVGSRDEKSSGKPYCSRYCCMAALKHASLIKKKYPKTEVTICYIDMRAFGFYENYFRSVQDMGVSFIRGRPSEVIEKPDKSLVVRVEDTLTQKKLELPADLVVLSAAMLPSSGTLEIAETLNIGQDENGFLKEKHSKLKPVDSSADGIFVCGTAQSPKDITDTIAQAGLAAARARAFIADSQKTLEHEIVTVNQLLCKNCKNCLSCPFEALSVNGEGKISVNPLLCAGCGYCTELCIEGALQVAGFSKAQLKAEIEGMVEGGDLLVFINRGIAYMTCDNIGNSVFSYPANVKIIRVPTNLVISEELVLYSFQRGAASVLMVEDPPDSPRAGVIYPLTVRHFETLKAKLGNESRLYFKKAYVPNAKGLADTFTVLAEKGEMIE